MYRDETYLINNPNWHIEDSEWKAEKIAKIIANNFLKITNVADYGCGYGLILDKLKKIFPNYNFIGYDISPIAINKAKEFVKDIKFNLINEIEEIDYSDLVLVIDVLEHIENYYFFLQKIKEKSNYQIFHIPLDINVYGILSNKLELSWNTVGHIHFFTKEIAINMLKKSNFEILDFEITKIPIEVVKNKKQMIRKYIHLLLWKLSPNFCIKVLGGYSLIVLTKRKNTF